MWWTRLKSCILVGAPKVVVTRLLDLLSPIAHHHSVAFLSAIGITWQEKRSPGTHGLVKNPLPVCNEDQQILVDMVAAIKTLPVSTVIQTVRQVLKSPPAVSGTRQGPLKKRTEHFTHTHSQKLQLSEYFKEDPRSTLCVKGFTRIDWVCLKFIKFTLVVFS